MALHTIILIMNEPDKKFLFYQDISNVDYNEKGFLKNK